MISVAVLDPILWHEQDEDLQNENRGLRGLIEATCDLDGVPCPPAAA